MPIVTEAGFAPIAPRAFLPAEALAARAAEAPDPAQDLAQNLAEDLAVDLPNDGDPETLRPYLDRVALIRIPFPSFADGRGFSLARRLRALGYSGRLRAAGHVISDQFAFALSCGFDEVEIDDALAARQKEAEWRAAARKRLCYRNKLRHTA